MDPWAIGFVVGGVVAAVVVVLLLLLIMWARKIGDRAQEILVALRSARDNTQALWDVSHTTATAGRIVADATAARRALETGGAR